MKKMTFLSLAITIIIGIVSGCESEQRTEEQEH